jgi:predicted Fe-Mo cluster-binding NifX family protein
LFDANAVGLAALLCSPLAGTVLMAVNYRRLGRAGKGALTILYGLIASGLLVLIKLKWHGPGGTLGAIALGILVLLCTWQIAIEVHGEAVEEHLAAGGRLGSKSTALLVGIASAAVLFGATYAVLFAIQERKVMIGTKDGVVYSGLATKGSAMALGDALKSNQYFQDRGATVVLDKGIGSRTISFVVEDGVRNRAAMLPTVEELVRQAAPTVGGLPVDIRLLDSNGDEEAKSTVDEVRFDNDNVVYCEGVATRDEAEELGRKLGSMGFFRGKGANVLFIRHYGEGTTLAFVVAEEGWTNPQKVSEFETIVREAAPAVGGLPLVMHLVDKQLELKKDELIE